MKKIRLNAAQLRMAIEWLRCPSNTTIRRRIYFDRQSRLDNPTARQMKARMDFIISAPRHERRLLLKIMVTDPRPQFWTSVKMKQDLALIK